jgi:glucose-6-phosphate-specific signal transduction histidine kinase
MVVLRVADDGIGTYPGCRRKSNSFGLIGIKERASSLGGQVTIASGQDKGTSLTVSIPIADVRSEVSRKIDHDVITFNSIAGVQTGERSEAVAKGPFDMRRKKGAVRQTQ